MLDVPNPLRQTAASVLRVQVAAVVAFTLCCEFFCASASFLDQVVFSLDSVAHWCPTRHPLEGTGFTSTSISTVLPTHMYFQLFCGPCLFLLAPACTIFPQTVLQFPQTSLWWSAVITLHSCWSRQISTLRSSSSILPTFKRQGFFFFNQS